MAVGIVFQAEGTTPADYHVVVDRVAPGGRLPAGMQSHVAGKTANGGICVVEIWESKEAADAFFQNTLAQALNDANIRPSVTFFEIFNTLHP